MADGMACRVPNPAAVDIITQNVDHIVTVLDSEIIEAMKLYFSATHNVAEGARCGASSGVVARAGGRG